MNLPEPSYSNWLTNAPEPEENMNCTEYSAGSDYELYDECLYFEQY